jgi:hypothetical protein
MEARLALEPTDTVDDLAELTGGRALRRGDAALSRIFRMSRAVAAGGVVVMGCPPWGRPPTPRRGWQLPALDGV